MQVVIDCQHVGRGVALGTAVLLDQLHDLSVERCLVVFLLSGKRIEYLRKGGILRLDFYGKFCILAGIVNFFMNEVGDLLDNFYVIPPLTAPEFCRCLPGRM